MDSLWLDSTKDIKKNFSPLDKDISVDVCIVGGGITGISTAYMLSKAGLKVCILEKDRIAHHATGNTTAKITSQHGLFYDYLINSFSFEFAKGYLEANQKAISNIKSIVDEENIDCDFEFQDNYVYTDLEDEVPKIQKEVLALNSLGINADFIEKLNVPFNSIASIKFPNQAQFNPIKYVYGLCNFILNNNGEIYENSKVYDVIKESTGYITYTEKNLVKSKFVVLASHYPIINVPRILFSENVSRSILYHWS